MSDVRVSSILSFFRFLDYRTEYQHLRSDFWAQQDRFAFSELYNTCACRMTFAHVYFSDEKDVESKVLDLT